MRQSRCWAISAVLLATVVLALGGGCSQSKLVQHPEDVRRLVQENPAPGGARFEPLPEHERLQVLGEGAPYLYRIGVGDELEIRGDTERLSELDRGEGPSVAKARVKPDGNIYLPVLGAVEAAGLTVIELQNALQALVTKWRENPFVTVDVIAFRSQKYYMLGAVAGQGAHEVNGSTTLLDAVTRAGGVPPDGDIEMAYMMRDSKILPVSLADLVLRGDLSRNVTMRDRDVVYVPRKKDRRAYVLGEVRSVGPVPMEDGKLTLAAAIASAGGLNRETADENMIRIFRGSLHNPRCYTLAACEVYALGESILLHPGDRVLVAPSQLATASAQLSQVMPFITEPATAILQPLLIYRTIDDLAK